jgi:hypothetical protein
MAIRVLSLLLLAGGWLAAGVATHAQSQANCEWYARTALKQQQENEQRRCGLKGPEWNSDLAGHLTWCRSVPPEMWKKQAQLRDQALSNCAKK